MKSAPPLHAFCINLDDRPERWADTQQAFQGSGITLERMPAIRHKQGWKGCGASQLAVVKMARESGWPWVLFVEDDCQLAADFASRWPAILDALWADRANWDIFLGGPTFLQGPVEVLDSGLIRIDYGLAAHFTIINASAYNKVLAWDPETHKQIDLYYANHFNLITAVPPYLATQRPSHSDIEKKSVDYGNFFKEAELNLNKMQYSNRTRIGTICLVLLSTGIVWLALGRRSRA